MTHQLEQFSFNSLIYGWNSLTISEKARVLFAVEKKCSKLSLQWETALNGFLSASGTQEQNDQFNKLDAISKILEKSYSLRVKFSVDKDFKDILKKVSEYQDKKLTKR